MPRHKLSMVENSWGAADDRGGSNRGSTPRAGSQTERHWVAIMASLATVFPGLANRQGFAGVYPAFEPIGSVMGARPNCLVSATESDLGKPYRSPRFSKYLLQNVHSQLFGE